MGSIGFCGVTSGRCRFTRCVSTFHPRVTLVHPSGAVAWLHVDRRCYLGSGAYLTLCWRWRSQYPHPDLSSIEMHEMQKNMEVVETLSTKPANGIHKHLTTSEL